MKKPVVLARLVRLAISAGLSRRARYYYRNYYRTVPTNSAVCAATSS